MGKCGRSLRSRGAWRRGLLFLALWPSAAFALAPAQINYQGKLTDANGNPRSGSFPMIFRIYDTANPPGPQTALYPTPTYTIAVANGVFNALIDVPAVHLQGGADRWLEVEVAGARLSPLHKLVSAPYALSVAANSVRDAEVAAGAGINVSKLSAGGTFPNGPFTFPNQVVLPGNTVFTTTGRLGIGNLNPQHALDIVGDVNFTGTLRQNGTAAVFSNWTNVGGNIYRMSNVGIQMNAPVYNLDVGNGARIAGAGKVFLAAGVLGGDRGLELIQENPTLMSIRHHEPGVAWHDIALNPHGGRVGINLGGANPGLPLDVGGRIRLRDGNGGSGGLWLFSGGLDRAMFGLTDPNGVGLYSNLAGDWVYSHDLTLRRTNFFGKVSIIDGSQGAGKVMVSDAAGTGTWTTLPPGVPSGAVMFFGVLHPATGGCPPDWVYFNIGGRVIVATDPSGTGLGQVNNGPMGRPLNAAIGEANMLTQLPSHQHTGSTAVGGQHQHLYNVPIPTNLNSASGNLVGAPNSEQTRGTHGSDGAHAHTFTTDASGVPGGVNVAMPYITLLPCMKQ